MARIQSEAKGWQIVAAGHRVVHGGDHYAAPISIDSGVLEQLEALSPLAPLHQPHNIAGIRAGWHCSRNCRRWPASTRRSTRRSPRSPACFALPTALADAGIKRYGFHGLSYEYIARRLREIPGLENRRRVIVAHLGNGASLCALLDGRSVASTMGFTALDGLMMGTRTRLDRPRGAALPHGREGHDEPRRWRGCSTRNPGCSASPASRTTCARCWRPSDPRAKLAVDLFVYRVAREIGSLAAALGGLDALVFTAGIGEHAAPVRDCDLPLPRSWLGVDPDPANSRVAVAVIPTNEEEMIARHTLDLVLEPEKTGFARVDDALRTH